MLAMFPRHENAMLGCIYCSVLANPLCRRQRRMSSIKVKGQT